MRAMVLRGPAPVEEAPLVLEDLAVPEPGPGQARIKVKYCGVCRTDLHIVEGDLKPPGLPLVPGHQIVGVVDSINPPIRSSGFQAISQGDRVGVPWLYSTCGKCEFCRSGRENLCEDMRFTGLSVNGGYEEYMVAPLDFLVKIPESFADLEAAPLLCAGIIGYRSLRVSGLKPGEVLGLFGFGASAHLAIQVARYWGCDVLVFTRSKEHQELALKLGAKWAGRAGDPAPAKCDKIITFAPVGYLIPLALEALKKGGTLAINAIHMDKIPEMSYQLLYWEKKLVSVSNSTRQDAQEFMQIASEIPIKVSTTVYPLEKANMALLQLKKARIQGEAVLKI